MLKFKALKAGHGDCILINVDFNGESKNILIDGGTSKTFQNKSTKGPLLKELEDILNTGQRINLLVLTHIDDDHIGGLLKGFKNNGILSRLTEKVWFNSASTISAHFGIENDDSKSVFLESARSSSNNDNTSVRQGVTFERCIRELGIWDEKLIHAGNKFEFFGLKFTIISPNETALKKLYEKWDREQPSNFTSGSKGDYQTSLEELLEGKDEFVADAKVHNGSSIAFIIEYNNKRLLFLGDSHSSVIEEQLINLGYSESNPIVADFVKLSHHGSKSNTSSKLISLISCTNFIISSNTNQHNLPNKRTIARILKNNPKSTFYFNYPNTITEKIFTEEDLRVLNSLGASCVPCLEPFKLT